MSPPNTDHAYLGRLRDYYAQHGVLPSSYAGISRVVGFRAKTAAVKLADRLSAAGYLRRSPDGKLAPADRFFELPLMEAPVRAGGAESVTESAVGDLLTLDGMLISEPSRTVLIRVKGDSMRDAGVLDGDLAIVERTTAVRTGQFVVAIIDGAFTLKELGSERGRSVLRAHNPDYPSLRPSASLEVFGVVRGIVRSYLGRDRQTKRTTRTGRT